MIKHIVVTGCSFTRYDGSWAYCLEKEYDSVTVHNVAHGGMGNYGISTFCINKVESLLSAGIDPCEILVITQWSGISRKSFIGDVDSPSSAMEYNDCPEDILFKHLGGDSKFCWDVGKSNNKEFWNLYKECYWSDECAFIETLEHILRTQWYLKHKNINFLMVTSWDLFTLADGDPPHSNDKAFKANDSLGQWDNDNKYINSHRPLLKDIFEWSTHLWNMIDLDRFSFFTNKDIKFGGILQYTQHMLDINEWYYSYHNNGIPDDKHPSKKAQQAFFNDLIKPFVTDRMTVND